MVFDAVDPNGMVSTVYSARGTALAPTTDAKPEFDTVDRYTHYLGVDAGFAPKIGRYSVRLGSEKLIDLALSRPSVSAASSP